MTKEYEYPVDVKHSTVLGYTATSNNGRRLWDELDWRGVRTDGGTHFMNPAGGEYLHVRVKPEGKHERLVKDRRWYRVRCRHEIGTKWRRGIVRDVEVIKRGQWWYWLVTTE
ncbi:MAG: hypothetical protein V3S15_07205 [Woeseiaceae bacterium]